eukprot:m.623191 g.623191  ORF g.623191 m.623191 type:complete len:318 (+) comp22544_c1_seq5:198-1151(+)
MTRQSISIHEIMWSLLVYMFFVDVCSSKYSHADATTISRPSNPVNVTVYGLRPFNLSADISEKNTADPAGDLFFWLTDRLVAPYACRVSNNTWWGCKEQHTLTHDSVYTKTVVEVDGTWPNSTQHGVCSTNPGHACYAACNPSDSSGAEWECRCSDDGNGHMPPCDVVGRANIFDRYPTCADSCVAPNDLWKSDLSQRLGGLWYSTPVQAECDGAGSLACQWRTVAVEKTVNATCVNANVLRAVAKAGAACYSQCPPSQQLDPTSDCSVTCTFQTILGKSRSFPTLPGSGMSRDTLIDAWLSAFESNDPASGGCPPL